MFKTIFTTAFILFSTAPTGLAIAGDIHRPVTIKQVLDGDTFITDHDEHIRVWGINSPERNEAGFWPAGQLMDDLVRGKKIDCHEMAIDRFGRTVMKCSLQSGQDIGSIMVESGLARDFKKYSGGYYSAQEKLAKKNKAGIWSGNHGMTASLKYTP